MFINSHFNDKGEGRERENIFFSIIIFFHNQEFQSETCKQAVQFKHRVIRIRNKG